MNYIALFERLQPRLRRMATLVTVVAFIGFPGAARAQTVDAFGTALALVTSAQNAAPADPEDVDSFRVTMTGAGIGTVVTVADEVNGKMEMGRLKHGTVT